MKIANLLLILLLPVCLGSCAPKVITHIERSYSPRVAAEEVLLYGVGQTVPESAELIGTVKVVDSGASTKCNYDQVVALAKQTTSKSGGNALALTDHREPSLLGSSCHQIAGNMLWIDDATNLEAEIAPLVSPSGRDNNAGVSKSSFHHSTIYANIGYDWVSRSGFGAGLMYSGYKSSYSYSHVDVNVGLAYIAPQFVMKQKVGRWGIEEKFGIGYFKYRESAKGVSESLSGFGYNFLVGAEYYLSDHIGIGANLGYIGSSLPKQDNIDYKDGEHSGIFRLHLDAGIRFHF